MASSEQAGKLYDHEIPSSMFQFGLANPTLTLSLRLTQAPLPQLTAKSQFMAGAWS